MEGRHGPCRWRGGARDGGGDGMSETATSAATGGPGLAKVEDVEEAMRDVVDPELGINVDGDNACTLDMTLTSAACPLTDVIEDQTNSALSGLVKETRINWVWMPPWGPDKITDEGRDQLRALGFNV